VTIDFYGGTLIKVLVTHQHRLSLYCTRWLLLLENWWSCIEIIKHSIINFNYSQPKIGTFNGPKKDFEAANESQHYKTLLQLNFLTYLRKRMWSVAPLPFQILHKAIISKQHCLKYIGLCNISVDFLPLQSGFDIRSWPPSTSFKRYPLMEKLFVLY